MAFTLPNLSKKNCKRTHGDSRRTSKRFEANRTVMHYGDGVVGTDVCPLSGLLPFFMHSKAAASSSPFQKLQES